MKDNNSVSILGSLKYDLPASIVVFLVALPLCLGISLASGADPITGVIAGIVGGVVVGVISKSPLGVSGPAAGIATIIYGYLKGPDFPYIDFQSFLVIGVIAGLFQVLFGYIKAGVIADYFPANVVKGMLAAIGVLIFLKQIPHALGDDKNIEGDDSLIQKDGKNTFEEIVDALQDPHWGAVIITAIAVLIIILWQTKYFKKHKILSLVPAPLIVVISGVLLNQLFLTYTTNLGLHASHLVSIPDFSTGVDSNPFTGFFSNLTFPNLDMFFHRIVASVDEKGNDVYEFTSLFAQIFQFVKLGFMLAIVLSLQTLLSSEASDKMDPYKRVTPPNKELIAQGVGNVLSSFIGGLPLTQVIVRSSANVNAGAKTKLSSIIHGVLLFLSVVLIPTLLNLIPLACLAGILFMIGYKLASVSVFKNMYKQGMRQFLPFLVTIIAIIFTNLLTGIVIGLIVSIFFILQNNRNNEPFDVKFRKPELGGAGYLVDIAFHEEVNYLSKHILMTSLHDIPNHSHVVIDGTSCRFIANDIIEAITEFEESVASRKKITIDFKIKEDRLGKIDESALNALASF